MSKVLNKKTVIIGGIAVVGIIAGILFSTSFSSASNLDKAKDIAKDYVPANAKFVGSEEEDRYYEVAFYDEENKEGFEVEVNKETEVVKKVESQLSYDDGGVNVVLTEEDAKKVVQDRFDGITSVSVVLMRDSGLYEYEASFKSNEFYGNADINAETGAILDSVIKFGTVTTIPTNESKQSDIISYEEASNLVLEASGGGSIRDIGLDREGKTYFYEVELHDNGLEKEYYVNAETGEVLLESEHECYFEEHHGDSINREPVEYVENYNDNVDNSGDNSNVESVVDKPATEEQINSESPSNEGNVSGGNNSGLISEAEAKDIVWAKIPGAEIVEFYLERDDGIDQYEGQAYLDGYEYEFGINAASGVIIDWDSERIEYDDEWDD